MNWKETYGLVKKMRAVTPAPVDTMGCATLISGLDPQQQRLHVLISLMLSSQTKDQVTAQAMARLRARVERFDTQHLDMLSQDDLQEIIYPVGFYRRKAAHLKQVFAVLQQNYAGDIPSDTQDMLALPGVGPKMAMLLQAAAWGNVQGIGVDTHVHRLAQMWNWVPKSNDPEKTRKALQDLLPQELWYEVNPLLVGFGQAICDARAPKCDICLLNTTCKGSKPSKTNARVRKRVPKTLADSIQVKYEEPDVLIKVEPHEPSNDIKIKLESEI